METKKTNPTSGERDESVSFSKYLQNRAIFFSLRDHNMVGRGGMLNVADQKKTPGVVFSSPRCVQQPRIKAKGSSRESLDRDEGGTVRLQIFSTSLPDGAPKLGNSPKVQYHMCYL